MLVILQVFPESHEYDFLIEELAEEVATFLTETSLFPQVNAQQVARYLFQELTRGDQFIISQSAADLYGSFLDFLKKKKSKKLFDDSVFRLRETTVEQFQLIRKWVHAYCANLGGRGCLKSKITPSQHWRFLSEPLEAVLVGSSLKNWSKVKKGLSSPDFFKNLGHLAAFWFHLDTFPFIGGQ